MTRNLRAFLDTIAFSELGLKLLNDPRSDNGYKVIVGGTFFTSYKDHPRKLVKLPKYRINSTAAGKYQILARYYDHYKKALHLPDFGPESQDKIAIQLIKECKAINDIEQGRIQEALKKCSSRWASIEGSPYGQHTNSMKVLLSYYDDALNKIA